MQQPIVGIRQDDERHWVAELACGHSQHVRHDPPWQERAWVLTEEGRRSRLGTVLNCVRCDETAAGSMDAVQEVSSKRGSPSHLSAEATVAYEDALMQGLCHEGALEIAERIDAGRADGHSPMDHSSR